MTSEQSSLVETHVTFAHAIAWQWARRVPHSVDIADLSGVAQLALCQSALRYRPSKVPFKNFAGKRIDGAIRDHLRGCCCVSGTRYSKARVTALGLDVIAEGYEALLSCPPTQERLALLHEVVRAVKRLPHRERAIITAWAQDNVVERTTCRLGISPARGTQLKAEALTKLRRRLTRS